MDHGQGKSLSFSDPARPPKHPKISPPLQFFFAFQDPRNILKKKIILVKKTLKFLLNKNFHLKSWSIEFRKINPVL